jgi:hypothetical protein
MEASSQSPARQAGERQPAPQVHDTPSKAQAPRGENIRGEPAPRREVAPKTPQVKNEQPPEVSKTPSRPGNAAGEGGGHGKGPANGTATGSRSAAQPTGISTANATPVTSHVKENTKVGPRQPVAKISTAKATIKTPLKSPAKAKTPTSPVKAQTPKLPSKTPERRVLHPGKAATPQASASTTKASTPAASKTKAAPVPIDVSPLSRGIGFVKPKPKSPTRPVQLPAGLLVHTASSATKVNASRQSLSRQSGNYATLHSIGRAPSRASVSTAATGTLKRQNSTIGRQRPSLGPPPKQHARDHPVTKREAPVDEDFLARMMRPTQSSQSKVNDKSPPRKVSLAPSKRPATRQEQPVRKTTELRTEPIAIKREAKPAAVQPAASSSTSTAKVVAPIVEQKATAEEIVAVAKNIEGELTSSPMSKATSTPAKEETVLYQAPANETEPESLRAAERADADYTPKVNGNHKEQTAELEKGANGAVKVNGHAVASNDHGEVEQEEY